MFQCKVCLEKDKRIEELKSQIEDLRKLAFPPRTQADLSPYAQEVDAILSGQEDLIQVEPSDLELEAAALLTGSYDSSQVEID